MRLISVRRLNIFPITTNGSRLLNLVEKTTIVNELNKMGYSICNPELLNKATVETLLDYEATIKELERLRGGDVKYVPLFNGFPNKVPEENEYLLKRIISFITGIELYDRSEFGADPTTQMQVKDLWDAGVAAQARRKEDDTTNWIDITLMNESSVLAELENWFNCQLYSKVPIKDAYHEDIITLLNVFKPDPTSIVQKENLALVMRHKWDNGSHQEALAMARTPTDILRLFAGKDNVSLSNPAAFPKFSRKERRCVLKAVNKFAETNKEDFSTYRSLWLSIARGLHPFENKNKRYCPMAAEMFSSLSKKSFPTFNSRTEALIKEGNIVNICDHLQTRPTMFARSLHRLLRIAPAFKDLIYKRFEEVAHRIPPKNLVTISAYFNSLQTAKYRTIINRMGKISVLENNLQEFAPEQNILDNSVQKSLVSTYGNDWKGKKIYIDSVLESYIVPTQERATSDGLLTAARGSRIPVQVDKVIRLFVYWQQNNTRTDLDLSCLMLDENFNSLGHVSYTRLNAEGITHSGDIQSAPHGAVEFIDISIKRLPRNVYYVVPQVYKFAGESFNELRKCYVGWQTRNKCSKNYKSFDIKTVVDKFDASKGNAAYCLPFMYSVKDKCFVMTDLYVGGVKFGNRVENAQDSLEMICKGINEFQHSRPNMMQLSLDNVKARGGTLVSEPNDADVILDLDTDVSTLL